MNRFDTQARLVFYYAREEATALNQSRLAPGHLLLGLMDSEGGAKVVLEGLGERLGPLRTLHQQHSPLADRLQVAQQAAFSPQIRRMIGVAAREAQALGTGVVSSQHLLLALMKVRNVALQQMLGSIEPDRERMRDRAQEAEIVMERIVSGGLPETLFGRVRAALSQMLALVEQEGTSTTARSMMVRLLLRAGDQRMLPWLEGVVYRWLTEDQVSAEEKRAVLHLLMAEVLPRNQRLAAG